jgi:hypothetical protein
MRKIFTIAAALIMTASVWAQAPEKMSYQAVVRNAGNALVTTQSVGMQISILQGGSTGTPVYVETQTPTTNINGLVSIDIGSGTVVTGTFNTIDWSAGPYFIKTETDPTGGTTYTITGTSQLMSVPYALHAKTAESVTGTISYTETDPVFGASIANGITALDTANWNNHIIDTDTQLDSTDISNLGYNAGGITTEVDGSVTNEIQDLQLSGNNLTITNNGTATTIDLSPYLDNTDTQLDETAVDAFVANNGYLATEVDGSVTNEIQTLTVSQTGDTLTINGGNSVLVPGISLLNFPPPTAIGDFRDGGVVFWLDGSGGGLVCAVSDQSAGIQWYNGSNTTTGAVAIAIGSGQANTTAIITSQGTGSYAASLCDGLSLNGYTDWFLPSKDELNEMYLNKTTIDITAIANSGSGFAAGYWSSTEYSTANAYYFYFNFGIDSYGSKVGPESVRAVRAF